jgi:hypothetical protein
MADVQVRRGAGPAAVLIGPPPAGPAGVSVIGIEGGDVHVDPAAPDETLHVVLHEPALAAPAVAALYGPAVAAAVGELGDDALIAAAEPGPLDAPLRRLALCRWLATQSPDQLPEPLLDIERGVAGAAAELAEDLTEEATQLLIARAGLIARLSRQLREPDMPEPPVGLAALLIDAVPAALEVVEVGSATYGELEHEQELAVAVRHLGLPSLTWDDVAALPLLGGRTLAGARHAGDDAEDVEQRASVDWLQVPRGVLATDEDTVRWTRSGPEVTVSVRAAHGAPDYAGLGFRVYAEGMPLPVARGVLRRSRDGVLFAGSAPLPDSTVAALTVDIYDRTDTRPPRLGVTATVARAQRWATRAVSLVRLGAPDRQSGLVAAAALNEAGSLYGAVVDQHPNAAHRARARRRQARCAGLQRAVLTRIGSMRQADAIGRRWSVDGPVTELDVAVPDLAGPGWEPTVAEQAVAVDPIWWRTS